MPAHRDHERDDVLRQIIRENPFLIMSPTLVREEYRKKTGKNVAHSTVTDTLGQRGHIWVMESPYHDECMAAFLAAYLTIRGRMGHRRGTGLKKSNARKRNDLNT